MRRLLLLLLFSSLLFSARAQAPATSDAQQLRARANTLLQSGSSTDAAQAAEMLDKASQIDARSATTLKTQAELKQLQQPAPSGWEPFVIQLTPFLSFVIVALTLVLNSYQSRKADQQKREEAARQAVVDEEKRFADAVSLLLKTENFSPAAAILSTFSTGIYAAQARQTAASLLLTTKSYDNFVSLFNTCIAPVSRDNLNLVLDLLRSVCATVDPLLTKTWINNDTDTSVLSADERASYALLTQERTFLGSKVALILTQPRPTLEPIDLTGIGFDGVDMTGADLRQCIAPSIFNLVNLDGADLRGITVFGNTWFYNTAWWLAAHFDKDFLGYLTQRFPYKEGQLSKTPHTVSAESYQENIARLTAIAV